VLPRGRAFFFVDFLFLSVVDDDAVATTLRNGDGTFDNDLRFGAVFLSLDDLR
jgi:hypothetical protein